MNEEKLIQAVKNVLYANSLLRTAFDEYTQQQSEVAKIQSGLIQSVTQSGKSNASANVVIPGSGFTPAVDDSSLSQDTFNETFSDLDEAKANQRSINLTFIRTGAGGIVNVERFTGDFGVGYRLVPNGFGVDIVSVWNSDPDVIKAQAAKDDAARRADELVDRGDIAVGTPERAERERGGQGSQS